MTKSDVLAKLEEYKDRPIEVSINGAGDITVYGNIDGHWLFIKDELMIAVAVNTSNGYGIANQSQREKPFNIIVFNFDQITYIKSYIAYENIEADINGLTPAATSKSLADIVKELQNNSINKANTARTYNNDSTYGSATYGRFRGSAISTSIDGLPKYVKDMK